MCNKLPRYDKNITRNTDKIKTEFFILLSPFGSGREIDVPKEHSLIFLFFLHFCSCIFVRLRLYVSYLLFSFFFCAVVIITVVVLLLLTS